MDEEIVAIIDILLEYKRVTSSHNKKNTQFFLSINDV